MKNILLILSVLLSVRGNAQNLILNNGFEKHVNNGFGCVVGGGLSMNTIFNVATPNDCVVQDWITISQSPDGFWYNGGDFPKNWLSSHIYPHSDSTCVGAEFIGKTATNLREIIEGKLTKPLIAEHHYQFSMYVQLFDSIGWSNVGKIVGCNSFSAVFTNTAIPNYIDLPIQNYTPQVQIDSMVIDTQHWVLLMDTFMANGGEQFVSIGNFKTDAQTQTQLVKTVNGLPEVAYYFIDDVSLIDLDDTTSGVEDVKKEVNNIFVYPNPTDNEINIAYKNIELNSKVVIYNYVGVEIVTKSLINSNGTMNIDVTQLNNGLYLYKLVGSNGNIVGEGKFNIVHAK